ncbi:DUF3238 domain-containing protein [Brevibacillus centrosporus]|nr:DUF3238 domain-containing protein [Brevibacillus centrosporus]
MQYKEGKASTEGIVVEDERWGQSEVTVVMKASANNPLRRLFAASEGASGRQHQSERLARWLEKWNTILKKALVSALSFCSDGGL